MSTLLIDNYDSFTWNLYQYIGELKGNPRIFRNDEIILAQIIKLKPARIVISPGPGSPDDPAYFGVCLEVIKKLGPKIPILGVCLGHQGIIYAFGGKIVKAPKILHGKTSLIEHDGKGIFQNIASPLTGMRYHSLVGAPESIPSELIISAKVKGEKTIMGVRHKSYPLHGIQFHPESIGTPEGKKILKNFLEMYPS